ncbi:ATP-grasp fold amidoligase family protein [Sporosarcina gallistercoris]|uniref:Glycosyl transferase n=1 Tax=Sporosarcina gallistercoris TaxID=2762245 RepID=A0ABR8PMP4_9BACL|nr:ATP-grasp fold amidoligase family protein [Sporosarcina gallistercoris]MBD7909419.1 glycosyl transferase [Sporosarcina gallistercoris]
MNYTFFKKNISIIKKFIPDTLFLRLQYKYHLGESLNLVNPKTFNEKIQWLKLYDRNEEYINLVDKYSVRKYISKTIGENYLIPLLGIYESVDEINWDDLPNKFVLKCTHGSSSNIICKNKSELNIKESKKLLQNWMKKNWFWYGREWPYKMVKPRIICEKYMVDESKNELKDYKFFCFNGEPKIIQVDYNRYSGHKRNLYDINWSYIDASIGVPSDSNVMIKRPEKLDEMLKLAKILAKNYPHVRVDFYFSNNEIFFGEMTLYHGSGFEIFKPESLGGKMGGWINLNRKKENV